jgi:hypothetical protein
MADSYAAFGVLLLADIIINAALIALALFVCRKALQKYRLSVGPNTRRWFQIHLSTAAILMLLASIAICLNTRHHFRFEDSTQRMGWIEYGWPFAAFHEYAGIMTPKDVSAEETRTHPNFEREMRELNESDRFWQEEAGLILGMPSSAGIVYGGAYLDVLLLLAFLCAVAGLLEYRIRTHESQ